MVISWGNGINNEHITLMKFMLTTILIEWWICTSSTTQGGGGSFRNRIPMGYYERGVLLWFLDGRALRLAGSLSLSVCLSFCLSLSPSFSPAIHLSFHLFIHLTICLSIRLSIHPIHLSIYLSIDIYPSIYLSIYLFIYLSIHLSIYLSIYLSITLSIYLSVRRLHTALHHTRTMSHLQGNKFSCHLCKGLLTLGGNLSKKLKEPCKVRRWTLLLCLGFADQKLSVRPSVSLSLLLSFSPFLLLSLSV